MMLLGNEWLNPVNRWRNDGYFLFGKPPHIRNFITGREVSGRTKGFKEKEMNKAFDNANNYSKEEEEKKGKGFLKYFKWLKV